MIKKLFLSALMLGLVSCMPQEADSPLYTSPKLLTGYANPLLDFHFTADPTAVEHEGRLYVYATNDHQQYEAVGPDGNNGYQNIHSLVMMSTDDMVNWTYHGYIDVKSLSPWGLCSWAPSITKRVEADGLTHFYMYYSNCGTGVGMLAATSPVGPWTDPLGRNVVDLNTEGLGHCKAPFDPGVVIDDQGRGWLAFGAGDEAYGSKFMPGDTRIVMLADDMMNLASPIKEIKTPYHFEASELNFINGKWIYSYNTSWNERTEWPYEVAPPPICGMSYMVSDDPLNTDSWVYRDSFFKNPMDYGMTPSNNHTHIFKYAGEYYILYHTLSLDDHQQIGGGFRSVCLDKIQVDEQTWTIQMGEATKEGVGQLKPLDPYEWQEAETVAATHNMRFVPMAEPGNTAAACHTDGQILKVRGVDFQDGPDAVTLLVRGPGTLTVKVGHPECGEVLAALKFEGDQWREVTEMIHSDLTGVHDLYFITSEGDCQFDKWIFTKD